MALPRQRRHSRHRGRAATPPRKPMPPLLNAHGFRIGASAAPPPPPRHRKPLPRASNAAGLLDAVAGVVGTVKAKASQQQGALTSTDEQAMAEVATGLQVAAGKAAASSPAARDTLLGTIGRAFSVTPKGLYPEMIAAAAEASKGGVPAQSLLERSRELLGIAGAGMQSLLDGFMADTTVWPGPAPDACGLVEERHQPAPPEPVTWAELFQLMQTAMDWVGESLAAGESACVKSDQGQVFVLFGGGCVALPPPQWEGSFGGWRVDGLYALCRARVGRLLGPGTRTPSLCIPKAHTPPPALQCYVVVLCALVGELTHASGHQWGPKAAVGEGSPTAGIGCPLGRTWPTATAVALLRVDPTQSSETGKAPGLRWHNLPREGKGCIGGGG